MWPSVGFTLSFHVADFNSIVYLSMVQRVILQKRDNLRATFNKMMYKQQIHNI